MWKFRLAASALACAIAGAALAQDNTPRIPAYCAADTAFGQFYGANRVEREGRSLNASGNRRAFAPSTSFPPFSQFEGGFTPHSRRLHSAQGVASFAAAADARSAFEAMVAALSEDPRFQENEIAEPDVSDSGAVWRTAKFYAGDARSDAAQPTGFRVTLYFMQRVSADSTIAMDCVNAEIYRAAEREALAD